MSASKNILTLAGVAILLIALLAPDPTPAIGAALLLLGGTALLWPRFAAPILMLPFGYQWLQVAMKPIYSAMTGTPLAELANRGADLSEGVYLALAGVGALAVGLRIGVGRRALRQSAGLRESVSRMSATQALQLALGAIIVGNLVEILSGYAGSARQILLGLSGLKLAGIFLLTYWSIVQRRAYAITVAVVGLDLLSGMLGFFANFRETLFVAAVAIVAGSPKVSPRSLVALSMAGIATVLLAVFWTAIKPDYRHWLNQGSGLQVVNQPLADRAAYILDAAADFNQEQFAAGAEGLISRLSYIDFISHTVEYVPHFAPHTGGEQTGGAIRHILTPRILFRDKPPLPHDTAVTARYTGLVFLGGAGTSISIGYLGELYADFGAAGAVLAALLLGLAIGRGFAMIVAFRGAPLAVNLALSIVPLMPVMIFETALVKVVGGGLMAFLTIYAFQRLVLPKLLAQLEARRRRRARRHAPLTAYR